MRLLLLRHAKSDWTNAAAANDASRGLAPRGRKDAAAMARYLRLQGYDPDWVLCSTAKRTRDTLKLIRASLRDRPRTRFLASLYLADVPALLAAIRKAPAAAGTVLLIGHNPGFQDLALALAQAPKTDAERTSARRLNKKFPTAGLAVLDFDASDWSAIKPKRGRLTDFVRPKDLHKGKSCTP